MADAAALTARRVDEALRTVDCSNVSARLADAGRDVTLSGYVPSEAVRKEIANKLNDIPLVSRVRADSVVVLPRPHCNLLGQLRQTGAKSSSASAGELAKLAKKDIPRFEDGDLLRLEMTAPDYPAYLYVDYYDSHGGVTHLLPGPGAPALRFSPGQKFVLGRVGLDVTVSEPFGMDVIVTVASPRPLFSAPRREWERADVYLADLRAAIQRTLGGQAQRAEYDFRFVLTAPKGGNSG